MKSDYYSMKSDYTMEDTIMKQSIRLRQDTERFNSLYKEMDDIYHDIAFSLGLSDSAFVILYFISILGDGCLQKDICEVAYISKQTITAAGDYPSVCRKTKRYAYSPDSTRAEISI